MHIALVTLFPEFFSAPLSVGLMGRAREAGILSFSLHNPRDRARDRHRRVDDRPYGGGPGMVMLPEPLADTLRDLGFGAEQDPGRLLLLSPAGRPLTQALARDLAGESSLTLICGRYEGIDARLADLFPLQAVSVGDFILSGGEAGALCLVEAVARLLPGFMGHDQSGEEESFSRGLLEYPHYTRPETFEGLAVPEVLRSGDHRRIALWRRRAALAATLRARPDLLSEADLDEEDRNFLRGLPLPRLGRNLYCGLVHYPVLDREGNSVAVSLTNLDVHDIARSSCAYGLGGYYVLTPLEDQRRLLEELLTHWTRGKGKTRNPHRARALSLVRAFDGIAEAAACLASASGQAPLVVGTTAGPAPGNLPVLSHARLAEILAERPVFLLFGTGHGLAPEAQALCHAFAPSLRRHGPCNHLSVRAAAAITLDRILGEWR
ncbi:MAG: tRNA (guanosine(37)-N1)-methyltransferase TrmD [Desulfovibrio sp.]|jgi:tRNA (guanine37-N1)-methyltransferase|nr:tRNA (guanosine(37)-N1)-methyltransferase TrmD [Desulfovibrio sp.]